MVQFVEVEAVVQSTSLIVNRGAAKTEVTTEAVVED